MRDGVARTSRAGCCIVALVFSHRVHASDTLLHVHGPDGAAPYGGVVADASGTIYGTAFNGGDSNLGVVWARRPNGAYAVLHSFGAMNDGSTPAGTLALDGSGFLYGVAGAGGVSGHGIVFKVKTDGTSYMVLHSFDGTVSDGATPLLCPILVGSTLYGTTLSGGSGKGVLYKLSTDGQTFGIVHPFAGGLSDGASPYAAPVYEASTGFLYGTAQLEGGSGHGIVYKVKTDGSLYGVIHHFASGASDGALPSGGVILDGSGGLFGTTYNGGTPDHGVLYTLTTTGGGFNVLHTFAGGATDGSGPAAPLLLHGGKLYGTSVAGGTAGVGTIYSIGTSGSGFALVRSFSGVTDGAAPECALLIDARGHFLGTATSGGGGGYGVVFDVSPDGQSSTALHEFRTSNGLNPERGLVADGTGRLYGTTNLGGAFSLGTVFRMNADGTGFTVLHNFQGGTTDGSYPQGTLALDGSGNVYGTTVLAGLHDQGTVFKMTTDGNSFALLHSFQGSLAEGAFPYAGVIWDGASTLYGTTHEAGAHLGGTVYALPTAGGSPVLLWSFDPNDNGHPASASLLLDAGYLYGTTTGTDGTMQYGNAFKLKTDGSVYLVLHAFQSTDGAMPSCTLVADGSGHLYGTTSKGGSVADAGTVFKVQNDGNGFQTLHVFDGNDGGGSVSGLVRDGSGALYGATSSFGASGAGTVFRINESGSGFHTLHVFGAGLWDVAGPNGPLLLRGHTVVGTGTFGGWANAGGEFAVFTCPAGDVDGNGTVDVADVFFLINDLFANGQPPPCTGDVNGSGTVDVADVFYLINYLFAGGPPPI